MCGATVPTEKGKEMSAQEMFVQQFERLFHYYQEAIAPASDHKVDTDQDSWDAIPSEERSRMVGAARMALLELETNSATENSDRRYYATPGSAEWGC